jgi:hypothetical protein
MRKDIVMAEPNKKPGQQPESYNPRVPEIASMVEQAQVQSRPVTYTVKTTNGGNYIDGVPLLRWGQWRDNTYCGCIAAVTEVLGTPVSYETLMGVSGICYRFAMKPDWCPSAAMAQVGTVWDEQIQGATGIKQYSLASNSRRNKRVRANLDSAIPVLGCGLIGEPEWDMLTGYTEKLFFGRSYFDTQRTNPASRYLRSDNLLHTKNNYHRAVHYPGEYPKGLLRFFDKPCKKAEPLALLKKSLEACLMYNAHGTCGDTVFGEAAYRILIEGLEKSDEAWASSRRNENYHIGCLADARRCAHVYLRDSAALLTGNKEKLLGIAEGYQSIVDDILAVVPYEMLNEAFAFNGHSEEPWSMEMRQGLVKALCKAIDTEKRIQADVKDILENWGSAK